MSAVDRVVLHESWKEALRDEFESDYMVQLREFLLAERSAGKRIFPPSKLIFNALDSCPLPDVKVVIIGQDPYIFQGQAHGLSFSVPPGVKQPPSLMNIFKEVADDLIESGDSGAPFEPSNGSLLGWAAQGVLLLNATLTVLEGASGSHQNKGWERFTDRIVEIVNERCEHIVFLLWGAYAKAKGERVSRDRHCVLTAAHPSPFSAHNGFFGCRHFSSANNYLRGHGIEEIDWRRTKA